MYHCFELTDLQYQTQIERIEAMTGYEYHDYMERVMCQCAPKPTLFAILCSNSKGESTFKFINTQHNSHYQTNIVYEFVARWPELNIDRIFITDVHIYNNNHY